MSRLGKKGVVISTAVMCLIGMQTAYSIGLNMQNQTYREQNRGLRQEIKETKDAKLEIWHEKNKIEGEIQEERREKAKELGEKEEEIKAKEVELQEKAEELRLKNEEIQKKDKQIEEVTKAKEELRVTATRGTTQGRTEVEPRVASNPPVTDIQGKNLGTFRATAYDLSEDSCGRPIGSKWYGYTASGYSLAGYSREQAMSVAVDPRVIPMGSKLHIKFPAPYEHFNGVYTARDTGGAIKGKKIDIFMGDFKQKRTHSSVNAFGVRSIEVTLLD